MGDLEDSILKQNVPGRYSSWSEENDDHRSSNTNNDNDEGGKYYNQNDKSCVIGVAEGGSDDEDDDYYYQDLPPPSSSSSATTTATASGPPMALRGGGPKSNNTGVKGVLADYHAAKVEEQLQANETKLDEYNAWYRMTHPAVRKSDNIDGNRNGNDENVIADKEEDGGSDDDEEEENELIIIRRRRLMQLKQQQQQQVQQHQALKRYGSLTCVTPDEYVTLVNKQQQEQQYDTSYLIVHLAEYTISQCCILHSVLEKLASLPNMEYSHNFIEVEALIAKHNLDTICLPTVLVYQHGVLIHNLVRFTDDLPREFGVEDVYTIFVKLGIAVGT